MVAILTLLVVLGKAYVRVELCDLVTILTRSRNFDRSSPVEIEMTKSEGQVLNIKLTEVGFIQSTVEVCRENTTLRSVRGCEVEVKDSGVLG